MSTTGDVEQDVEHLSDTGRGPVLLRGPAACADVGGWLAEHLPQIEHVLRTHGGIVLRGFDIGSVREFNRIAQIIRPELLDYVHRSTPRRKLGGKVFTATEYPADRVIPLHNESSYSDAWPAVVMFYSAVVARTGGETPVADSRAVYRRIDPEVRDRFERDGVCYVRNYTPGIDLSWQDVFQTDNRGEVEQFCEAHGIEHRWGDGRPQLTTSQRCQATLRHPGTGEPVWFNQAHLFHLTALDPGERQVLVDECGADGIPRTACYGDGTAIEPEALDHIRDVYEQEKVAFLWQQGDVMVLDNVLSAHGRNPYGGPRKVVVAMG